VGINKKKTIFSDLVNSLSSAKFLKQTDYGVLSRDYIGLKVWDIRGTSEVPQNSYNVCDFLEKNLCSLYEEDSIYDKFFMDLSPDGKHAVTGNYNKNAHIIDIAGTYNVTLQTQFDQQRGTINGRVRKYNNKKKLPLFINKPTLDKGAPIDFKKKVLIGHWSPVDNLIALGFRNCIFLY